MKENFSEAQELLEIKSLKKSLPFPIVGLKPILVDSVLYCRMCDKLPHQNLPSFSLSCCCSVWLLALANTEPVVYVALLEPSMSLVGDRLSK